MFTHKKTNEESQTPLLNADEKAEDTIELKEIKIESKDHKPSHSSITHLIRHLEEIQQAKSILEFKLTPAMDTRNIEQYCYCFLPGCIIGWAGLIVGLGVSSIMMLAGSRQQDSLLAFDIGMTTSKIGGIIEIGSLAIFLLRRRYCRDRWCLNLQHADSISAEEKHQLDTLLESNGILGINIEDRGQILNTLRTLDDMSIQINNSIRISPQLRHSLFAATDNIRLPKDIAEIIFKYTIDDPTTDGLLVRKKFREAISTLRNEEGEPYFSYKAESIVLDYLNENNSNEEIDSPRRLMIGA